MTSERRQPRLRLTERFGFLTRSHRPGWKPDTRVSTPDPRKGDSQLKSYFDRFREITKGTNRVALLWLGALIIVWYTGLERTRRDANENFVSLQINNSKKQKFENQIWQDHQKFVEANLDAQLSKAHQSDNEKQQEYETQLQEAERSKDEKAIKQYKNLLNEIRLRLTPLDKLNETELDKARSIQEAEKRLNASAKLVDELKHNQESKAEQYQESQLAFLKQYQELREQRKGVNFEILNQKFEVPPLYAALIWSVFLSGLILYVARARSILLSLSGDVLSHSPNQVTAERHLRAEAPWWLAPLPRLQFPTTRESHEAEGSQVKTDSSQLYRLLNWENGNRIATLLVMLSLLCLTLVQIRVVWLELEISRLIGTMQQRAVVPVVATAVLFLTFLTVWFWLRFRHLPVSGPEETNPNRVRRTHIISLLVIAGVFVFLFVFMRRHISLGISYERGLKASLFYLSVLLIFLVIGISLYEWFAPLPTGATGEQVRPARFINRRWFLYAGGIFVVVGGIGIGRVFANATKKQLRDRWRRPNGIRVSYRKRSFKRRLRRKKSKRKVVSLTPGFYRNPKTQIVHFVSKNGYLLGSPNSEMDVKRLEFLPDLEEIGVFDNSGHGVAVAELKIDDQQPRQPKAPAESNLVVQAISEARPNQLEDSRDNKPTLFSRYLVEEGGQPFSLQNLATRPRVELSTASQAFDETVLSKLAPSQLTYKDYEKICELLAFAINHDILMKSTSGQLPNFRLYDLLAGISVRYNRPDYLNQMLRLIENSNNADIFRSRMRKWQDNGSSWYRQWSNRRQPITWSKVTLNN